ncbi:DNA double-strand break repair protein Mre11 [Thermoplasmatales archaeon]|nr:DNA double-strand break repair protein Mre11 [Thermoplasmatales archaeon]
MVRFLHLSDTHLGARQYMMELREEDFYDAFREAIDIGLAEDVDFFVHSGDLFHYADPSNRALTEFKNAALRIRESGKKMYVVLGDHDRPKRIDFPAADIFDHLNIVLLGRDGCESTLYSGNGEEVMICGISNMKGFRKARLPEEYRKADAMAKDSLSSVLITHQAVEGYLPPEECEALKNEIPVNFSYMAFGHIHDSDQVKMGRSVFAYAGSTEMTSTREIKACARNGKAVNLVTLENGNAVVKRINLRRVRPQIEIDAREENYLALVRDALEKNPVHNGKLPIVTLKISGKSDRLKVGETLEKMKDTAIFRKPEFISEDRSAIEKPDDNSMKSYFAAYFKDNAEMASLAEKMYESLLNDDDDRTYSTVLGYLGITEER